jgi:hypothetical protein
MDWIEQAIFTSAETDRTSGYQVVAASPGIREADVRELAAWGPSHGALLDSDAGGSSLNAHPLPSGGHCVSRTTPAGWEYSGRGGARVYTHCLVVPPQVLARFANNPFALWRAVVANGSVHVYQEIPRRLEPVRLPGRAAAVDTALLAQLCANPGPQWMATLVQAALDSVTLAIIGGPPAENVIAGLVNCLPPGCRTEFSFSTGLKFSSRRPFRVVALSADRNEQRRVERLYNVAVLALSGDPPVGFAPVESWPRLILRALRSGRLSFLESRMAIHSGEISLHELPAFGLQMLEELDASALNDDPSDQIAVVAEEKTEGLRIVAEADLQGDDADDAAGAVGGDDAADEGPPMIAPAPQTQASRRWTVAHGPQRRKSAAPATRRRCTPPPCEHLDLGDRAVLEKLERLDDLVFDSIAGKAAALEQLKELWPQLCEELEDPLLAESREHYLRHALSAWGQHGKPDGVRDPNAAVQLLEVLCTLFQ